MSKIKTIYTGNLQTETEHLSSGIKIITNAGSTSEGKEQGISPTELLTNAYIGCVLTIIGFAAQTHGFTIDGAEAEAETIKDGNPRRITEIIVTFTFPHNQYSSKERRIIEASMKQCPVGNSLHPDMKITKTIIYKE